MGRYNDYLDAVEVFLSTAKKNGVLCLTAATKPIEGSIIEVNGKEVVNFGSCSYLGMEFDKRLKSAAIEGIHKYGTQFSSSRGYMSIGLYKELETVLEQVFGSTCVVASTTTLAHFGTIPVLVKDKDAVIFDHQVHSSVQTAISLLKSRDITIESIRHNNMEMLEEAIVRLLNNHDSVWYMADGIYSMFGDHCPVEDLQRLLDKYKNFKIYIDDAHGMSWYGDKGKGYALSHFKPSEQVVVLVSLSKAFGCGGAAVILHSQELKDQLLICGGTFIFSGPIQPAVLSAALASAKLHLEPEFKQIQQELWENIWLAKRLVTELDLPIVSYSETPVFFIGLGHFGLTNELIEKLLDKGHYINIGCFPAVSTKKSGLRITITRKQSKEQIKALFYDIKMLLDELLTKHDHSYELIYRAFGEEMKRRDVEKNIGKIDSSKNTLTVHRYPTINQVNKRMWDKEMGGGGIVNYNSLKLLEDSFSNNLKKEDNWEFEYIIIKDEKQIPVLMTYLSISLNKDDMLSSNEKSLEIEKIRAYNPYFLTSEILSVGTPITEGEQMYINRDHPEWKKALHLLLELLTVKQEKRNINQVVFRDFELDDPVLESIFINNGYLKYKLLNNNYIDDFSWENLAEFKKRLTKNSKRTFQTDLVRNLDKFKLVHVEDFNDEQIRHWYDLYLNVQQKNLTVNTFKLPFKLFKNMANDPDWHVFELYPHQEFLINGKENKAAAVGFVQVNGATANFALIGMDYDYNDKYRAYLCTIYQVLQWAKRTDKKRINLGYTADREKKKVGAKQSAVHSFVFLKDEYNMKAIESGSFAKEGILNS